MTAEIVTWLNKSAGIAVVRVVIRPSFQREVGDWSRIDPGYSRDFLAGPDGARSLHPEYIHGCDAAEEIAVACVVRESVRG